MSARNLVASSTLALTLASLGNFCLAAERVDFSSQIRPLFNQHCTSCHGGVKQAGDLSFIYEEQVLDSGAVVPSDPANSELIARITSTDPELRMPPVSEHPDPLSEEEIQLFTDWIAQGAAWKKHWSLIVPEQPPLPKLADPTWARLPLDQFIQAKLEAEELFPSAAAPPAQWLRRASFDLIGLPPTLQELTAFEQACDAPRAQCEAAFAREVDRLLASPHFGERWAAMWLDLARYADSQGFEKDNHRDIWPFRDWVIDAFNADLPFDKFTIKQLAGDLLPEPTAADLVATAFHRNTQTNTEGGTDDEEFRVAAVIDRINTTWTVWHGTTFGCVQCHSHPYDTFRHEEYYRFMAFFNNSVDHDLHTDFPTLHSPPDPDSEASVACFQLQQALTELRQTINRRGQEVASNITDWQPLVTTQLASTQGQLETTSEQQIRVATGTIPVGAIYTVTTVAQPLRAIRLDIFPSDKDPTKWPERGSVLSQIELVLVTPDGKSEPISIRDIYVDHLTGPYDPINSLLENKEGLGGFPKLLAPRWAVFLLEQALAPPDGSSLVFTLHQRSSTAGGQSVHLRSFALTRSNSNLWQTLTETDEQQALWKQHRELAADIKKLASVKVPIMQERSPVAARSTRVFIRGNWLDHGPQVSSGVPGQLHPLRGENPNRLDLARWLVAAENPLTARVLANRLWAELFGIGLVETLEDFGSTGTPPSHPQLLDHLALQLQHKHQWHVKPFLRDLVLSSTYRQSNRSTAQLRERDPRNRLLSRGPRTRLTAEMVRDQALVASALFNPKQGGPSVMPPQPEGVWQTIYNDSSWKVETGPNRFRRAIYTYWKRTSPYPSLMTFDTPSREVCTPRRISTNTPLQALVTLNDPTYLELSQGLATRAQGVGGQSARQWIGWIYQSVTQRVPTVAAQSELEKLYEMALDEYEHSSPETWDWTDSTEVAALAIVANTVFNLDEALTK